MVRDRNTEPESMDIEQRLHISKHILFLLAGAFLLLSLFGGLLLAGAPRSTPLRGQGKIQEITLENDQAKLRIQRNGVVEITTKNRTIYQFWDQDRVNRLFALLEQADWSKFGSRLQPGQKGYLLTLTTDAGVITVAIPEDSTILPEGVKQLISLFTDLVQQAQGGNPSPSVLFPSPSPSPLVTLPSPSPLSSPHPAVSPSQLPFASLAPAPIPTSTPFTQEPFICHFTGTTLKIKILSDTLCDLLE